VEPVKYLRVVARSERKSCNTEISGTKTCLTDKKKMRAGRWWLISVIPATWEVEIRRIVVGSQPGK
jgi:hypothetical protein